MVRVVAAALAALALVAAGPARSADRAALTALEQSLRSGEIKGVHSVLVMRGSETVAEWYFEGQDEVRGRSLGVVTFGPETLHDVRSVTKSVVGLLVGIALQEGAIKSLDTPVLDYFPEYADLQTPDLRRITLRHLLTMGSGLHWDEETYGYDDPRNSESGMDAARDRYRFILSQPIEAAPGSRFKYSGGDVALMGAVLARATQTPLDAYAQAKLFGPLGIAKVEWQRDAKGTPYAASGLRMRPRDMAKVGRMVLHDGRWEGRPVIPAAWVRTSIQPHARVQPDPKCGGQYGYFWWLQGGCALSPPQAWASAIGNGGQRIAVVPALDLVIVVTAGLYNNPGQRQIGNEVVERALAAVR
jgi:CubicO group peptidase (beta-lactamase class C family)